MERFISLDKEKDLIVTEVKDNLEHISDLQLRKEVVELVENYTPKNPRDECLVKMRIVVSDKRPVYQKPRSLAMNEREDVKRKIQEWLTEGIIRSSSSDYASPIVLVKKKDGTNRICIDYGSLNAKIIKEGHCFTALDFKNGFFHVDIDEHSQKYNAPFGLCNPPSVFQRFVNAVFEKFVRSGWLHI